jgi:hypothetical protein
MNFKQLKEVDEVVGGLYQKNPKLREGKFGYAYKRFYDKNLKPLLDEIQEKMADCRVENAMVDEKTGHVLAGDDLQKATTIGDLVALAKAGVSGAN